MRDQNRIRKILPVDLMLEGRPCLVVGGGFIAARKVGHLLEAGAKVTIVSAVVSPELGRWIEAGKVTHRSRAFRDADLRGQFLVMAATDNAAVNARVVKLCRRAGILCASADAHWVDADFLTPATLRRPGLTLTVSTGGESCRRSRLVKDYLARRLGRLDGGDLTVWTAPRQPVAGLAARLDQVWGIQEFVILDEGARLKVLAVASREKALGRLVADILKDKRSGRRVWRGMAALWQTVALAAGPAASELRKALRRARAAGWAGAVMDDWIETVLRQAQAGPALRLAPRTSPQGHLPLKRTYKGDYERIIRGL